MRDWLEDRFVQIGAIAVVVVAVAFSFAPVWWV